NSSLEPNSLAGKIQGNFIESELGAHQRQQKWPLYQCVTSQFPTHANRELIGPYQGIKSAYQGSFLPDQGRVNFPAGIKGKRPPRGRARGTRAGKGIEASSDFR